jgi:hypothetical protein
MVPVPVVDGVIEVVVVGDVAARILARRILMMLSVVVALVAALRS